MRRSTFSVAAHCAQEEGRQHIEKDHESEAIRFMDDVDIGQMSCKRLDSDKSGRTDVMVTSMPSEQGGPLDVLKENEENAFPPMNDAVERKDKTHERVKVFVRVRPTKVDAGETPDALRFRPDGHSIGIFARENCSNFAEYSFDRVMGPDASQSDVYSIAAKGAVTDVLRGFNATVLAYGQTGAGKTHTLGCAPKADSIGIIPRAISEIFAQVNDDSMSEYEISLSYLQVYCEKIQDLLCPENGENLAIREDTGGSIHVAGLTAARVASLQDCLQLMQLGNRNRKVAFTALNAKSSRSHAVLMSTVVKRSCGLDFSKPPDPNEEANAVARRVRIGRLYLVDLAGSERLKKSGSTGQRASEAKHINLSLTTLGKCINARAIGANTHVPFRDSKLTRLLQDSLGGNARTSLIIAVTDAQEHSEESLQSLSFGQRAMSVMTSAKINECIEYPDGEGGYHSTSKNQYRSSADMKSIALEKSLLQRENELEAVQDALRKEQLLSKQTVQAISEQKQAIESSFRKAKEEYEQKILKLQKELEASHKNHMDDTLRWDNERKELIEQKNKELEVATSQAREAYVSEIEWKEKYQACQDDVFNLQKEYKDKMDAMRSEYSARESNLISQRDMEITKTVNLLKQLATVEETLATVQSTHEGELEKVRLEVVEEINDAKKMFDVQQLRLKEEIDVKDQELEGLKKALISKDEAILNYKEEIDKLNQKLKKAEKYIWHVESKYEKTQESMKSYEKRALEAENAHTKMIEKIIKKRRFHCAAAIIQRYWRKYNNEKMRKLRDEDHAALYEARDALGHLVSQHADLERRRHDNLAFTGQSLVGESLEVLQDAVEGLLAYFLLPSKELKAVMKYRSLEVRRQQRLGSRTELHVQRDRSPSQISNFDENKKCGSKDIGAIFAKNSRKHIINDPSNVYNNYDPAKQRVPCTTLSENESGVITSNIMSNAARGMRDNCRPFSDSKLEHVLLPSYSNEKKIVQSSDDAESVHDMISALHSSRSSSRSNQHNW